MEREREWESMGVCSWSDYANDIVMNFLVRRNYVRQVKLAQHEIEKEAFLQNFHSWFNERCRLAVLGVARYRALKVRLRSRFVRPVKAHGPVSRFVYGSESSQAVSPADYSADTWDTNTQSGRVWVNTHVYLRDYTRLGTARIECILITACLTSLAVTIHSSL